jgi:hypothetical protein
VHSAHNGWSISVRAESKLKRRTVERKWWDRGEGFGCVGSSCLDGCGALSNALREVDDPFLEIGEGTGDGMLRTMLSCNSTKDSLGNGDACFLCERVDADVEAEFLDFCQAAREAWAALSERVSDS